MSSVTFSRGENDFTNSKDPETSSIKDKNDILDLILEEEREREKILRRYDMVYFVIYGQNYSNTCKYRRQIMIDNLLAFCRDAISELRLNVPPDGNIFSAVLIEKEMIMHIKQWMECLNLNIISQIHYMAIDTNPYKNLGIVNVSRWHIEDLKDFMNSIIACSSHYKEQIDKTIASLLTSQDTNKCFGVSSEDPLKEWTYCTLDPEIRHPITHLNDNYALKHVNSINDHISTLLDVTKPNPQPFVISTGTN